MIRLTATGVARAFSALVISSIEPLSITTVIARAHAEIWAELESAGNPIGAHDLWIAATALNHGMDVATANARDFKRVPSLNVVPV
jgi:tRNA(fMet)-specific endonuclease VapC